MHENVNLLMFKKNEHNEHNVQHKFQQKSLILWHFLLIFTNCVDFNVGLRNVAKR